MTKQSEVIDDGAERMMEIKRRIEEGHYERPDVLDDVLPVVAERLSKALLNDE